jgi:hypothetical protein
MLERWEKGQFRPDDDGPIVKAAGYYLAARATLDSDDDPAPGGDE